MISPSAIDIVRKALRQILDRLDRIEKKSPRAQKHPWYRKEFHLPPALVFVISTLLLYLIVLLGTDRTVLQAVITGLFVLVVTSLFCVVLVWDHARLVKNGDAMTLLAVIFFTTVLWIKGISIYSREFDWLSPLATPIGIGPVLATLLLHRRVGLYLSILIAMVFGLVNEFSLSYALVAVVGGLTGVVASSRAKATHHIARAGVLIGASQIFVIAFLAVVLHWKKEEFFLALISAMVNGVIAAAFCLGVLPYLESLFSHISNLRLLELAAINHPLLQKMSIEAPGTYHHSLIVASLAEDAANAIGANGLLCRVGAYFHDIGKMVKAEYFIENQGTFGNPHDQVSPSLSKLVITSHVKEGLALAKAHKLNQQVMDFIPQHHGTSKIEYFYHKALRLEEEEEETKEEIPEETYRYPGPKPQSKETGIVMLSDSVEAASRTLEEPNHQRYKDLVNKIIHKKLFDGQLDETALTLRDLHLIADRFVATLMSIHHSRIPYPDADVSEEKEKKDELS